MEKGEARQMRFPLSICFGKVKYGERVRRGVSWGWRGLKVYNCYDHLESDACAKQPPWRDIFLWRQQLFFKSPQECEAKFLIFRVLTFLKVIEKQSILLIKQIKWIFDIL